MRRTFLTLYTPRSYKSQKQIKPLPSEMPQQKQITTKNFYDREKQKTPHHRRYKKQKTSITEKKQKSLIDIKNEQPKRAVTQLALR